ncbi:uncharacterized protein VTP21DRAFT_11645 [Calcarisporiella thermophila]|uniref:uncharacterized protein n=1 Tax=Calcarisporiella thermophila TaxID=911321 RepID=UPI0037436EFA
MAASSSSVQFTVGKLDAGMALLLTADHHLIEFPSLLLPKGVTSGSIVNISVQRNRDAEQRQQNEFWQIQDTILNEFGTHSPEAPVLRVRAITQTSVTLEWDPLVLHSSEFRRLEVHRDGQLLQTRGKDELTAKISGLEVEHAYDFGLILRTSAGVYPSNKVRVRTHAMANLTGLNISFGAFDGAQDAIDKTITDLKEVIQRVDAQWNEEVTSDTTHLIATLPGGKNFEKAMRLSIPIVKPEWLIQCEKNSKLVPCLPYYLVASPQTHHAASE